MVWRFTRVLLASSIAMIAACSSQAAPPRGTVAPPDVAAPPDGAAQTATGLAYRVLTSGPRGPHPVPDARVLVHYTGWTTDGTVIDGAPIGGDPATVDLGRAMPGWREGLSLMAPGDKYRFWIPPPLAYQGQPGKPQGMLVFDIYLIRFSG
jgi:FKBP-type peptidyl-prolyl cis-trans isomerase